MSGVVRVYGISGHRAVRSNVVDGGTLEGAGAGASNVELSQDAVPIPHKAVTHIFVINIPSRDRSIGVEPPRKGTLVEARTGDRRIENCNRATLIQQEAVIHKVRVNEDSQDASIWSKAAAIRTLKWTSASARKIVCGDNAVGIPQEAVNRVGCVEVEPCYVSAWGDREALRTLVDSCARTRRIECGYDSILSPQEAVQRTCRINVVSRDILLRFDEVGAFKWKGPLAGRHARARRVKGGNGLCRSGYCQSNQDDCCWHQVEFLFCGI